MTHAEKLESLVNIGRAFEASGRWGDIKIDGTGEEPTLIVRGSTARFDGKHMTLTGRPWRKND